jgi:hypothetical protein
MTMATIQLALDSVKVTQSFHKNFGVFWEVWFDAGAFGVFQNLGGPASDLGSDNPMLVPPNDLLGTTRVRDALRFYILTNSDEARSLLKGGGWTGNEQGKYDAVKSHINYALGADFFRITTGLAPQGIAILPYENQFQTREFQDLIRFLTLTGTEETQRVQDSASLYAEMEGIPLSEAQHLSNLVETQGGMLAVAQAQQEALVASTGANLSRAVKLEQDNLAMSILPIVLGVAGLGIAFFLLR